MNNGYRLAPSGLLVKPHMLTKPATTGDEETYVPESVTDDETPQMASYRWTDDDRLVTDAGGIDPIREVSPGDYDLAADSDIWKAGSGRAGRRAVVPDPDKLAAIRRVSSRVVDMQEDDALIEAMTEDEFAESRGLARALRENRRTHEFDMARFELDEEKAEAKHAASMRQKARQLRESIADAKERHRQASDPTHRLVLLSRLARWLPLAALLPGLASVAIGLDNAGSRLGVISPATQLVNYAFEPMFSIGVLVILVAQWLGAVPSALHSIKEAGAAPGLFAKIRAAASNGFFMMELLLFALTVVLQVGIHYVGPHAETGLAPLVWMFVPLGLLISMALVPAVASRLNAALADAVAEAEKALHNPADSRAENREKPVLSTDPDLHRKNPGKGDGEGRGEPVEKPAGKKVNNPARYGSKQRARAEFFRLVQAGELDPQTETVNGIAKRLGVRWDYANTFITDWRTGAKQ